MTRRETPARRAGHEVAGPTSPEPRITDLRSLLEPSTESELVGAFLGKTRLLVKTPHPRRAEALLPRWMLDRLIGSNMLPEGRFQVLRGGDVVAPARFRTEDGRLRLDALEALATEGVSFVVNGIDDEVPAIARVCDSIERRLGASVWVNAYVTHGPGGALAPHYDDHDVVVLQVHGKKRWFGHGTPCPSPIERSGERDFGPPVWDLLLEPGDVLFVPRGEVHHTSVEGDMSVHLTFGIDTRRGVDLVSSLLEDAAGEVAFREDVTRVGGAPRLRERERQLKDRLHALVEALDLEAYLACDDAARPLRSLSHLGAATPPMTDASVIVPTPRRALVAAPPVGSAPHDATRELRAGGRSFRLSTGAAQVLSYLLAHDRATLAELGAGLHLTGEPTVRDAVSELARLGLAAVEL